MLVAMYVSYVTAVLYNVSHEKYQNYYNHYNLLYFLIKVCSSRLPELEDVAPPGIEKHLTGGRTVWGGGDDEG